MEKITLKDFWSSKKIIAIHCDSEEKAIDLLNAFNKLGKRWCDGESYLDGTNWDDYLEDTCYSNLCGYSGIAFYEYFEFEIYEFENVNLDD